MKKKLMRSIICFLLSVVMITECNVGTLSAYATESATEDTESETRTEATGQDDEYEEEDELVSETEETEDEETEEPMPTASSYLYPFEEAVTALEELAASKEIQAVIYLADSVTLKSLPDESSEPVKNLVSGDVVNIIGAGQDAEYNIWYRVFYKDELEEVTGYVRKDNVACVDLDFALWQENYVRRR